MDMTATGLGEPLLMVPGPVPVSAEVLAAAALPPVFHHAASHYRLFDETRAMLAEILGCRGSVEIMPGGGRLGLEAAIRTTVGPGDRVLLCSNGFFAGWLEQIARRTGAAVDVLSDPPGSPADTARARAALAGAHRGGRPYRLVLAVHCETATGTVTPLRPLGEACREYGALLLADAVSSAGVVPLDMEADLVDLCGTASQKGLGSLMGLSVVGIGERARAAWAEESRPGCDSFALDLTRWRARPGDPTVLYPVVPSPTLVLALHRAARLLLDEGLKARFARHEAAAGAVREILAGAGLKPFGSSPTSGLTTVELPADVPASRVQRRVLDEHGVLVATGMGADVQRLLRVSHMGLQAYPGPLRRTLRAVLGVLAEEGVPVTGPADDATDGATGDTAHGTAAGTGTGGAAGPPSLSALSALSVLDVPETSGTAGAGA